MIDVYFSKHLRGSVVVIEPTTNRGFDWAHDALQGCVVSGHSWRVEPDEAYDILCDAERSGLCVENRI